MDNLFNIETIGEDKVLFTKLPVFPLTREEALNIAAWLIIKAKLRKSEVVTAVAGRIKSEG